MNSGRIIWSNNARCAVKKLDKLIVKRIIDRVESLQLEGLIPLPLVGKFKGIYKLYVGD